MRAVAFLRTGEKHPASVMSGYNLMGSDSGSGMLRAMELSAYICILTQRAEEGSDLC